MPGGGLIRTLASIDSKPGALAWILVDPWATPVIGTCTEDWPEGTVMLAGTVASEGLSLVKLRVKLADGAGADNPRVITSVSPDVIVTLEGVQVNMRVTGSSA